MSRAFVSIWTLERYDQLIVTIRMLLYWPEGLYQSERLYRSEHCIDQNDCINQNAWALWSVICNDQNAFVFIRKILWIRTIVSIRMIVSIITIVSIRAIVSIRTILSNRTLERFNQLIVTIRTICHPPSFPFTKNTPYWKGLRYSVYVNVPLPCTLVHIFHIVSFSCTMYTFKSL